MNNLNYIGQTGSNFSAGYTSMTGAPSGINSTAVGNAAFSVSGGTSANNSAFGSRALYAGIRM